MTQKELEAAQVMKVLVAEYGITAARNKQREQWKLLFDFYNKKHQQKASIEGGGLAYIKVYVYAIEQMKKAAHDQQR